MSITIRELCNDTYHFVSKEIKTIVFISILATFISILINILIKPDLHIISIIENKNFENSHSIFDLIHNMNLYEKKELLKYSIFKMLEFLINKTFLLGSIITFIKYLSNGKKESFVSSIYYLIKFLPSLFILNFITIIAIQIGFMFFILPGIFLSILLSLSPIILSFKNNNLIDSIRLSFSVSYKNLNIIGTSILFWICIKFIFTTILSNNYLIGKNFIFLILNINMNIFFSILIIYLFRFYMLSIRSEKN
ncbi:YciC family protein [Buchnera aphidicola]|uniref:YciC family protein n=1 Tax=Buchnera aphidicola TaxID=9 RepID=UPI003463BC3D